MGGMEFLYYFCGKVARLEGASYLICLLLMGTFQELLAKVPPEIKKEVDMEFAVSDRLYAIMENRGISVEQLASVMGVRPATVKMWISGQHNFTLSTLARLSVVLGEDLIVVA